MKRLGNYQDHWDLEDRERELFSETEESWFMAFYLDDSDNPTHEEVQDRHEDEVGGHLPNRRKCREDEYWEKN